MSSKCMIYVSCITKLQNISFYHISHDMDVNNIKDVCLEATNVLDSEKKKIRFNGHLVYFI